MWEPMYVFLIIVLVSFMHSELYQLILHILLQGNWFMETQIENLSLNNSV